MSLLIKGMSMPKSCKDCLCREYPKFSFESDWCCLNQKTISDVKVISPNCPLVNVPTPHGRLIDADKLLEAMSQAVERDRHWVNFFGIVDESPTIIEAEVSE